MTMTSYLKPLVTTYLMLLALWVWVFTQQTWAEADLLALLACGGLLVAAVVWHQASTPGLLLRRPIQIGIGLVWGLSLLLMVLFQVPSIRNDVTFPWLAQTFPQANILAPFGINQADYEVYLAFKDGEGRVFDARRGAEAYPLALFDRFTYQLVTDDNQNDPLTQWRAAKYPGLLRQADVQYLYVDSTWISYLSQADYELLINPDYYNLVVEAQDGDRVVYLYEVVGQEVPPDA